MTVYNVNLGIGWASSGVEYAQSYRAKLLHSLKVPAKFIFSDMILANNIEDLTSNLGFNDEQIIWLYNFFTDVKIAPSDYLLDDWKKDVNLAKRNYREEAMPDGKNIRYILDDEQLMIEVRLHDSDPNHQTIDQVTYVSRDIIVKRDFYSYVKYATEYYTGDPNHNFVVYRDFYNEDGSVAYTEYINGKSETFQFPNGIFYTKNDLYLKMIKQLHFTADDAIIIDRMDDGGVLLNGQLLFEHHGDAKIVIVVHADHFDKHYTNQQHILWNNFYEYQFGHADDVAAFVVSTDAQKKRLVSQFNKYEGVKPLVVTIPVGSLPALIHPQKDRQPYSMITASRLAPEKHLDWLIQATVLAKKQVPQLTLDIYGEGVEKDRLQKLIDEQDAGDYITLKGQHDLTHIYSEYEAYVAASTSEGFGLSLMEAVGSGLPMIGFDVPYGNPTFIDDGKNGHLINYQEDWQDQEKIQALADGMIQLFTQDDWQQFSDHSYKIADNYLSANVAQRWQKILEGLQND